jgi:hypothetical protein
MWVLTHTCSGSSDTSSILAARRSRCRMPRECRCRTPAAICCMAAITKPSDTPPCTHKVQTGQQTKSALRKMTKNSAGPSWWWAYTKGAVSHAMGEAKKTVPTKGERHAAFNASRNRLHRTHKTHQVKPSSARNLSQTAAFAYWYTCTRRAQAAL